MAENKPGDHTRELAAQGHALSLAITKFAARWASRQRYLTDAAAEISGVSAILEILSDVLIEIDNKIEFDESVTKFVCGSVKAIFELYQKALDQAKTKDTPQVGSRNAWDRVDSDVDQEENSQRFRARSLTWGMVGSQAFADELGGFPASNQLEDWLVERREQAFYITQSLKYMYLKKLETDKSLDPEQTKELARLDGEIPKVLSELNKVEEDILRLAEGIKAGKDNFKTINPNGRQVVQFEPTVGVKAQPVRFADDNISLISYSDDGVSDTKDIYEAWNIRGLRADGSPRHTWTFLGLKAHEAYEGLGYVVEAAPQSRSELKTKYESLVHDPVEIQRIARTMDSRGQFELHELITDRKRATINRWIIRQWEIISIKRSNNIPPASWWDWWKGTAAPPSWDVILKATTMEDKDKIIPSRTADPFLPTRGMVDFRPLQERPFQRDVVERDVVVEPYPPPRLRRAVIEEVASPEETQAKIAEILGKIAKASKEDGRNIGLEKERERLETLVEDEGGRSPRLRRM